MGYKDFVKLEMERAKKNDWFDPDGNNAIAVTNRGFIAELKTQISGFNYDIKSSVNIKELTANVINVCMIITLPVSYLPFLVLRTYFTRKRAKKEMMESYEKKKPA